MPADTTFIVNRTLTAFIWFAAAVFVALVGVMIYFVVRYHHRRNATPSEVSGNTLLELIWIIVPTVIGIGMFFYGLSTFQGVTREQSADAFQVDVTAFTYGWEFGYPNGVTSPNLEVPQGQEIFLNITSRDLIHSFYAPAFRIKMDAVPGMKTHLRFDAHEIGSFDVLCAEYCGIGHSQMFTSIVVVPPDEFEAWYAEEAANLAASQ